MKKFLLFIAGALSLYSCAEETTGSIDGSNLESAYQWNYTAEDGMINNTYYLQPGDYVSFSDSSVGCTARSWVLSEGGQFLSEEFDPTADLSAQVSESATLYGPNMYVYGGQVGNFTMTLSCEFPGIITFDTSDETLSITKNDNTGNWIMSKVYNFVVYNDLVPTYEVYQEKSEDIGNWALVACNTEGSVVTPADNTITIGNADRLKFVNTTLTGGTTTNQWYIKNEQTTSDDPNAYIYTETEVISSFASSGTFESPRLTVYRNMGEGFPYGENEEKSVDLPAIVVEKAPETPLYILDSTPIEVSRDDMALVPVYFNTSLKSVASDAPFTVTLNNTTVGIENQVIAIDSFEIDNTNPTLLNITLSERLYEDDIVTISYTASDDAVVSASNTQLESFEAQSVIMPERTNVTANANVILGNQNSFETEHASYPATFNRSAGDGWYAQTSVSNADSKSGPLCFRTDEQAHEGSYSAKITISAEDSAKAGTIYPSIGLSNSIYYSSGTSTDYVYECWIYVSSDTNIGGEDYQIRFGVQRGTYYTLNVSTTENLDQWVKYTTPAVTKTGDAKSNSICVIAYPASQPKNYDDGEVAIFIDDVMIYEADGRPTN